MESGVDSCRVGYSNCALNGYISNNCEIDMKSYGLYRLKVATRRGSRNEKLERRARVMERERDADVGNFLIRFC